MWLEGDNRHARTAVDYAEQVVAGSFLACQQIKQSAQRFLDDIDGDRWEFRPDLVQHVCAFIELLPHTKGTQAARKELIRLEPWQVWVLAGIFGFVDPRTGYRKVNEALLIIPRKNGKSTFSAGIALYMAFLDGEQGAEVWIGANSMDQADACFVPAKMMAERSPDFLDAYGVTVHAKSIFCDETGSFVRSMIGKPGDGSNPHCAILDEAHENDSSEQYDTMKTGMGARAQPLLLTITTAGFNLAGPCRQRQLDAEQVLLGNVQNDSLFAAIFTIDPDDDWRDFEVWKKANPNFGVSVHERALRQAFEDAQNKPAAKSALLTKHLNVWENSSSGWLPQPEWLACASDMTMDELKGREAYLAFDLSTQIDITALVAIVIVDAVPHIFPFFFLPEGAIPGSKNEAAYRDWVSKGHIIKTSGNSLDFEEVKAKAMELIDRFDVRAIGYDQWQAHQLAQELSSETNIDVFKVAQNIANFNPAMLKFEAAVVDRQLRHNDNPCMNWMAQNVSIKNNDRNHLYPNKPAGQRHLKIDGIVAALMAMSLYMNAAEAAEYSIDWI